MYIAYLWNQDKGRECNTVDLNEGGLILWNRTDECMQKSRRMNQKAKMDTKKFELVSSRYLHCGTY